ncbi:hypothetical protein CYMTET_32363 [Cymbomonas tetramitiformis]|uniref:Xylose isomerase-like TIM barrel domain-containing protein n=1 Tax=Cymbomonas tetramitiformis TaxID=36881 RepID=A0AAE0FF79_9CHLO|nr:hypothetical protein CYMTET_32363 [Cymbomonas tetramitiformis]
MLELYCEVQRLESSLQLPMLHEIHRGRAAYSPWSVRRVLPRVPDVKFIADYAHFTCVTEVAPGTCPVLEDALKDIRPHVGHIHARIGYENGPQIPDPRAPEWMGHTEAFEAWWDAIWMEQARIQGKEVTTMTPEHGPATYQPALPYTRQPIADIDEINLWLGRRATQRISKLSVNRS